MGGERLDQNDHWLIDFIHFITLLKGKSVPSYSYLPKQRTFQTNTCSNSNPLRTINIYIFKQIEFRANMCRACCLVPSTIHVRISLLYKKIIVHKINRMRPRQSCSQYIDDIPKHICWNRNVRILIKISLNFVAKCQINNIIALVQIMAWRQPGDKPMSEPMLVSLLTHICVTRPWLAKLQYLSLSNSLIVI